MQIKTHNIIIGGIALLVAGALLYPIALDKYNDLFTVKTVKEYVAPRVPPIKRGYDFSNTPTQTAGGYITVKVEEPVYIKDYVADIPDLDLSEELEMTKDLIRRVRALP